MLKMGFRVCDSVVYKQNLCKVCYIQEKEQQFHCTHAKCIRPVFALTLCQKHFKMYKRSCLLCTKPIHCKNVCRKHYQDFLDDKIKIQQPMCKYCLKAVYVDKLCLQHFKDQYSQCMFVGCDNKSHKKGLCCAHYFQYRRSLVESDK